ncbi:MAG: MurR/RpiR family transcriptional regulator [Streptococcaceae bacterium]|jgi:DNA-binding MurR/RpiR family transcriptional regulator|nr:MurR/RpiR family transcriptional regulator [Streptococcaceae bacterium]
MTKLTHSEYIAWDYLENNLAKNPKLTVHKISEKIYVSSATIIRAIQKKGFDGFLDYKNSFKIKSPTVENEFSKNANRFIQKNIEEVTQTINLLEVETLEKAIQLLNQAENILIISEGPSASVARMMTNKLRQLKKNTFEYSDPDYMILFAKRMAPSDLLIAVTMFGETIAINTAAKAAHKNKSRVLALTTNFGSSVAELADCVLLSHRSQAKNIEETEDLSSRMPLEVSSRILLNLYEVSKEDGTIRK